MLGKHGGDGALEGVLDGGRAHSCGASIVGGLRLLPLPEHAFVALAHGTGRRSVIIAVFFLEATRCLGFST